MVLAAGSDRGPATHLADHLGRLLPAALPMHDLGAFVRIQSTIGPRKSLRAA